MQTDCKHPHIGVVKRKTACTVIKLKLLLIIDNQTPPQERSKTMGQRAIVAIKKDNTAYVTEVQWAYSTPDTYKFAIAEIMKEKNVDFRDAVETLATNISKNSFMSALTMTKVKYMEEADIIVCNGDSEDEKIIVSRPCLRKSLEEVYTNIENRDELISLVKEHGHSQDGISVIIDLDTEDVELEFYMDKYYGEFDVSRISEDSDFFPALNADNVNY